MIEYCLFIEINFMCQDLRMEFVGIQFDLNTKVKDHYKRQDTLIEGVFYYRCFEFCILAG